MKIQIIKNIVLFLVGFCAYITIEVCFRGFSYPLMGLCGGLSIVLLDKLNNHFSWDLDILLQGTIGSCIITLFELIIGLISYMGWLPIMWSYINIPLNFMGIICLPFSLIWILLSIIAIFIADAINYYIFNEQPIPYYNLFGKTIIRFKERNDITNDDQTKNT